MDSGCSNSASNLYSPSRYIEDVHFSQDSLEDSDCGPGNVVDNRKCNKTLKCGGKSGNSYTVRRDGSYGTPCSNCRQYVGINGSKGRTETEKKKHTKCKMDEKRILGVKKTSYLEIFREKVSFRGSLLSKRKQDDTKLERSNQMSNENAESCRSTTVDDYSLFDEHLSTHIFSMEWSDATKVEMHKNHTSPMESHSTDVKMEQHPQVSLTVKGQNKEKRNFHRPFPDGIKTSIPKNSCRIETIPSPHLNKLDSFLKRTSYGNSVSNYNCRVKVPSQEKTKKCINVPLVKDGVKEAINNEKNVTEKCSGMMFHKGQGTKKAEERKPNQKKSANQAIDIAQKKKCACSGAVRKNENHQKNVESVLDLDILLERHQREVLLSKQIQHEILKQNLC